MSFQIRESLEETWHGHHLVIEPFTGREALSAAYKFGKYTSGAIGKLTSSAQEKPKKGKAQTSLFDANIDLEGVFESFFAQCTEQEFMQFAELLLSRVKINNVPTKLESNHFLGYPERIMELLIKSIKYQFSGFFSGLQSKIPNLKI
jgi:hypothetical protein